MPNRLGEIVPDPERDPAEVADDASLTAGQRRRRLDQLIQDLEDRLRASEENMSADGEGQTADRLRRAHEARRRLD
ncbi:MAG: hypothetical protein R3E77_06505 [Steroidobacteraceae bacterium]